jgi:hypothetical protein
MGGLGCGSVRSHSFGPRKNDRAVHFFGELARVPIRPDVTWRIFRRFKQRTK